MNRLAAVVTVSWLLLVVACDGAHDMVRPVPADALTYAGYDAEGRLVVEGWLRLDVALIDVAADAVPTPIEFAGEWQLRALVDRDRIGPQDGRGTLAGTFAVDGVAVDLQPGTADDNVRLLGVLTAGGPAPAAYEGRWTWETLAGIRAEGTFRATR